MTIGHIFRKNRVWLGNAGGRRLGIFLAPTEIDPFEWQALRVFNTTALVGNTANVVLRISSDELSPVAGSM